MGQEIIMQNPDNLIIKFNNVLLKQNMHFNAREKDIFFLFCAILKERGIEQIDISFVDIKKAINEPNTSNQRLSKLIDTMTDKLLNSQGKIIRANGYSKFVLFTDMEVDNDNGRLTIAVNPRYVYLLNDLISDYTSADFRTYLSLKSKYSKDLFFWLLKWKYTGKFIVTEKELRKMLNIPESYKYSDIRKRVLTPSMVELYPYFQNLTIKEVFCKSKKQGRPNVERYIFTFVPFEKKEFFEEEVYVCPKCGGNLILKKMNGREVYCHKDGAFKDAKCHEVFETWEIEDMEKEGKTRERTVYGVIDPFL